MSISARFMTFIGIWLVISIGFHIFIINDMKEKSPQINSDVTATLEEAQSFFEPLGYTTDISITDGWINFKIDKTDELPASLVKIQLFTNGKYQTVNYEASFSIKPSTQTIYNDMEYILNYFDATLDNQKDEVLEMIRTVQSDQPDTLSVKQEVGGCNLTSRSDRDANGNKIRTLTLSYGESQENPDWWNIMTF